MLVAIISRPSSITSQIPRCTPELWPLNCPKLGFPLSKSQSCHPVVIKLSEYVGGHNISTKFYNHPNPPCTPEWWPLNCPKLGFPLSKSKSSRPVLIKLCEYVGGCNISTKFYNQPNPPCTPELCPLNCPKLGFNWQKYQAHLQQYSNNTKMCNKRYKGILTLLNIIINVVILLEKIKHKYTYNVMFLYFVFPRWLKLTWHTLLSFKGLLQDIKSMQFSISPLKCNEINIHNWNPYCNDFLYH